MGAAEREATGPQPAALSRDTPAPHCPCLECVLCTSWGPGPTGHSCWEAATLILGRSCISVRQELSPFPSRQQSLHPGGGFKSGGAECFKPSVFPPQPISLQSGHMSRARGLTGLVAPECPGEAGAASRRAACVSSSPGGEEPRQSWIPTCPSPAAGPRHIPSPL